MLKKIFLGVAFAICSIGFTKAQVINFEDLTLQPDSFWNGSDLSNGFNSGPYTHFPNYFIDYGGGYTYWDGFSYSNKTNDSLQDYGNMYSCYAGQQLSGSTVFAVSYNPMNFSTYETLPTEITFQVPAVPQAISVTNSAYTALTIKNGDMFSKKFGGVSGDDPDWFKLDIIGINDTVVTDTVHFYLADYRFSDNLQDYIIKNWTDIDLTPLGQVTKIQFLLSSSDTGAYGMNTPAFFCFDNLDPNFFVNIENNISYNSSLLYPNPTNGEVYCEKNISELIVFSVDGKEVFTTSGNFKNMNISQFPSGVYIVKMISEGKETYQKLLKE